MEQILTGTAPLIRQPLIAPHNGITNRTFRLPLDRALHITLKRCQRIDDAPVEDGNRAQRCAQPGLPLLLVDGDAGEALDAGRSEGEGRWESQAHRHGSIVDGVGGCYFVSARGDFHGEWLVFGERVGPGLD